MANIYQFQARLGDGQNKSLDDFRGRVLLIVNVASRCGFTPQYEGLQKLQARYHPLGFDVLAFPCDQFGHQEPGDDASIAAFCATRFAVSFPLFAKIEVNGAGAHPLYRFLKAARGGLLGSAIKWNFTKFLVDRTGQVVKRLPPTTKPEALAGPIEALLG